MLPKKIKAFRCEKCGICGQKVEPGQDAFWWSTGFVLHDDCYRSMIGSEPIVDERSERILKTLAVSGGEKIPLISEAVREYESFFPTKKAKRRFYWCFHCSRVFRGFQVRICYLGGIRYLVCPYDECDGSPFDFIPWRNVKGSFRDLPEVPQQGKVYGHP